jgi:hypothetical protein
MPLALIAGSALAVLASQTLQAQRRAISLAENDVVGGTLRAAWRADVERAHAATVQQGNETMLSLKSDGATIFYRGSRQGVTRVVSTDDDESATRFWRLRDGHVSFAIESIGNRSAVVWMTLQYSLPQHGHRPYEERVVAAAAIEGTQP